MDLSHGSPSQQPDNSIQFDISYTKTIPGLLKAAVILSCILNLVCINMYYSGLGGFDDFTAFSCLFTSLFFWLLYSFRIPWRFRLFYWYLSELIHLAIFFICFAICTLGTLIMLTNGFDTVAKVFAAMFGGLAAGFLGYDAYMKFHAHRRGEKGPGVVVVVDLLEGHPELHHSGATGTPIRKETVTTVTTDRY
jgi:hypothetical protein